MSVEHLKVSQESQMIHKENSFPENLSGMSPFFNGLFRFIQTGKAHIQVPMISLASLL